MTKESVELSWTLPADDGGSPVVGYVIEECEKLEDEDSELWKTAARITGSDITLYTLNNLIEGHMYAFRVKALSKAGLGLPCDASPFMTAKDTSGLDNFFHEVSLFRLNVT